MVFDDFRRKRRRKSTVRRIEKELREKGIELSSAIRETVSVIGERTDQEYTTYLEALRDGAVLIAEGGINPHVALLCGNRISRLIAMTETPETFYQFLEKLSQLGTRLTRDYENPVNPLMVALNHVPKNVTTITQFEEHLRQYERYFRLVAKPTDKPPYHSDKFYDLQKAAESLEEICLGVDCLEMASNAGIYNYVDHYVNHELPYYCIKAAKRLPSLGQYKQRFSKLVASLNGKFFPRVKSYGAPVVALIAGTDDEIEREFNVLERFKERAEKIGEFPGTAVMELVSVVSDHEGYVASLDSIAKLVEASSTIPVERWKIVIPHYRGIVTTSENASQAAEYVDCYIAFWQKMNSNPTYHEDYGWGGSVSGFVEPQAINQLPLIAQMRRKYGDFEVNLTVSTHTEHCSGGYWGGDSFMQPFDFKQIDSVKIDIKPPAS